MQWMCSRQSHLLRNPQVASVHKEGGSLITKTGRRDLPVSMHTVSGQGCPSYPNAEERPPGRRALLVSMPSGRINLLVSILDSLARRVDIFNRTLREFQAGDARVSLHQGEVSLTICLEWCRSTETSDRTVPGWHVRLKWATVKAGAPRLRRISNPSA